MAYHIWINVLIVFNLICIFFFVANTWKYTLHAIQDIESYPMHENPEVIDLLERYKLVAIIFGLWIFLFDFALLAVENQWISNVSIPKNRKAVWIGIMGLLTICDFQIYNIIICIATLLFAVIYYLNQQKDESKENRLLSSPSTSIIV